MILHLFLHWLEKAFEPKHPGHPRQSIHAIRKRGLVRPPLKDPRPKKNKNIPDKLIAPSKARDAAKEKGNVLTIGKRKRVKR